MSPFFSIITPVLNGACYVNDYLYSLRSQTFLSWEAIIIDDGSTDSSFETLRAATHGDSRFVLKRLPSHIPSDSQPRGPYRPRNYGISLARGEYICFLDIDDFWLNEKLMIQYEAIRRHPEARLVFSSYYTASHSLQVGYIKPFLGWISIKNQVSLWNPIPNLTGCVQVSLARMNYFLAVKHEDFVFWHGIICLIEESNIVRVPQPLAIYRRSRNSLSGNKLAVVSWWLRCYDTFGYPLYVSCLFLLVKILAEFVEKLLVSMRVIRSISLSSFCSCDS